MIPLLPIGARVLVSPIAPPDTTESGLHLVEHAKPEQMGTVVALGDSPYRGQVVTLLDTIERLCAVAGDTDVVEDALNAAGEIRRALGADDDVSVGDLVLFSWASGQEVTIESDRYLILKRDDILAVVENNDE